MIRLMLFTLVLAATASAAWAQETPSAAEQFAAIEKEYRQAQQDFFTKYRAAKTAEERQEAIKLQPRPDMFADRFIELAKQFPDEPEAVKALAWVASNVRSGEKFDLALDILHKQYVESEHVGQVCQMLPYAQSVKAPQFLRDVMEKNPHESVKGMACFSLAKYLKRQVTMLNYMNSPETVAQFKQFYGEEFVGWLQSLDADEVNQEVEGLFERVVEDSTFSQNIRDSAERELFEIRNLAIGKVAPEIEGEDIDGVDFKLTDYRGKVVVLDFWGHW